MPKAPKHAVLADEIDAIGTKRYESQSGGEREIQRTMLELLNQMDGFDSMGDVKVRPLPSTDKSLGSWTCPSCSNDTPAFLKSVPSLL